MQPFVRPEMSDLMNECIDVLSEFRMPENKTSELRWCHGEVVHVYEEQRVPTVCVCWDPIPDCTGWETATESNQKLLPTKWNKDVVGAWKLDLPIDIEDTTDNESDGKSRTSKCDFDAEMEEYDSKSESS